MSFSEAAVVLWLTVRADLQPNLKHSSSLTLLNKYVELANAVHKIHKKVQCIIRNFEENLDFKVSASLIFL